MRALLWIETLVQDLRYGGRELARNKGFTATAVISLAFGIMAATAMYSVVHGVVLQPFPYRDVDNLVSIAIRNPEQRGWRTSYSIDEYAEFAANSTIFEGLAAATTSNVLWISRGEPVRVRGNHISNNGFEVMGVPALLGRIVTGAEAEPESKVVLGYRFWKNQLGGDASVLGATLILNGRPRTVVGVMPPRFVFRGADVYLPLRYRTGEAPEGVTSVELTGRRRQGVTAAQAEADLDPIVHELAKRFPERYPSKWRIELITFKETFPSRIRQLLWIMFAAVGLLLLIACTNVSSLLLARASTRQREMAVRAALGAGRDRLFRQLITESLLLGLTGGALGIAGSWAGLRAIMAILPPGTIPEESEVVLNFPVLLFSFGLCLVTTLLFGFVPARHTAGSRLIDSLKQAGRGSGGSKRIASLRCAIVVLEVSLAVILLSGAALFVHTVLTVFTAPFAVGVENRLTMQIPLSVQRYPSAERRAAFISQLLGRVDALPGVIAAGINAGLHPLGSWDFPVDIPGSPNADKRPVNFHQVNAGYLKLTGIKLIRGRWLEQSDIAARRQVVVVNETFVKRYFPATSPLGRLVKMWRLKMPPFNVGDDRFEVVGVVQDALFEFHNGDARPEMYIPYSITGLADMLVVHTSGDPMRIAPLVRAQIYQLDGSQFVHGTSSLEGLIDRDVYSQGRFRLWLMGVFGGLGLCLAVIGVYGLLLQVVSMQRREFGIRMAVGARFKDIVWLVLRRGVGLMIQGLVIGIAMTLVLLKVFGIQLGVTDPFHLASIAGACLVLFLAGIGASVLPALRAGRTNPVNVLGLE
jgi:predicted permease